ncbi:hypothetical protein [Amnibacterium endophyticum]|uniref:DUF4384 domain-containing protein n=1 Tax=Amnibacterium endophyticum TaxID=2109337 RepID=A0ABW4LFY5_9MICO
MTRKAGRFVVVLLGLIAVAALVVLGYATGRGSRLEVASVEVVAPVRGGDSSAMTGRLGASRSQDHACFWLDPSGSQSEDRIYLLFAERYSANDALALLDEQGRLIAKPGDVVTAVNAEPRDGAAPQFCPSGPGMTVYAVHRAGS